MLPGGTGRQNGASEERAAPPAGARSGLASSMPAASGEAPACAYRVVGFDLDGTLLYTLEDLALATNHVLAAHGMPTCTTDEVRSFVGNGYRNLIRLATPDGTPEEVRAQMLREFNRYYLAHDEDHTAPYAGIPELLARLQAAGIAMAVVSNKGDEAVRHLMGRMFPGVFRAVAGEREGVRRKPAPDTLLEVMRQLGVTLDQMVLVGDSEVDVATAANTGCACIAATWGYRSVAELEAAGATVLVDSPEELGRLLLG